MRSKFSFISNTPFRFVLLCSPLLVFSSQIAAAPIVGGTETITGGTPERWDLTSNATLNVNGAQTLFINADGSTLNVNAGTTQQINAGNGSKVNLSGATVTGVGGLAAVLLSNSEANIENSTITGNRVGLQVVREVSTSTGSTATVNGSTITGVTGGALVSGYSSLDVTNSTIQGTGATSYGVRLLSAQAMATNSTIIGGQDGIILGLDPSAIRPVDLTLDNTTVQGQTGSAIVVDFANAGTSKATITLNNSQLVAGNDTLLDVRGGANASMEVNNSVLTGNLVNEAGSTLDVTLQNNSVLTGRLENVSSMTINETGLWELAGDSQVETLALNGGTVRFGSDSSFYQLDVNELSGNGRFELGTDFVTGQTDLLNVMGNASGRHELLISSSGVDPVEMGEAIRVVQTAGGDAQFYMDRDVDFGTFSYGLAKSGNDWILDPSTRTVSPGTRSILALFNTAPTVWYGELTSLRTRMGELRFNGAEAGSWGRVYGNKYNVADASGVGYKQTQQGFTLGADAPLPFGDGQWLVGVMAGHSKSDLDLTGGTSGTVNSNYLGTYATWIDAESGYYFDGVVKFNHFENDAKVGLSDGRRAKGDYDNTGLGGSLEVGRHIKLDDGYFIEPYTKWSAVVIQGENFSLDNGMRADGDRTRSLLGEAGMTVGRNYTLENDMQVQPYVRVGLAHEFVKNNEVSVNNNVFNNDLSGSRGELAAGVAVALTDRLQMHVDLDYSKGEHIERPIGANFGVRYGF